MSKTSFRNIDDIVMSVFGYELKDDKDVFNSDIFNDYKKEDERRKNDILNPNTEGSQGKCKKCGSLNTFPLTKQTRSGDEGMSNKIVCADCQSKWDA